MDLSQYTQRFHDDLVAAAALGDERTQQLASALAKAADPALRLVLMSALSELAAQISQELEDRTVDVRVAGDNISVVVIHDAETVGGPELGASAQDALSDFEQALDELGGNISRVTLRLVDGIKARAEEAASANGVSLNSWVSQAVRGALRDQGKWSWEPPHSRTRTSSAPVQDDAAPDASHSAATPEETAPASESDTSSDAPRNEQ
ncbi:toxin-antitoxin system HicB family antitoxin [Hoyosella sp. YIM 151337]|uniref:toxin-antitoxin system HicB family antitoxin n=1 Tax=Hoyosella sp. YIM 151337 TaxID=2992742 RepID=UPI002235818A|nr:toxin-antitoxin system HicB family antitoxin [Hoyosella sp. YIM 151337]MCW4353870.1 toxin-antitoxin system HicB family antitoxin [Hoyosella sp. YIM 151337]